MNEIVPMIRCNTKEDFENEIKIVRIKMWLTIGLNILDQAVLLCFFIYSILAKESTLNMTFLVIYGIFKGIESCITIYVLVQMLLSKVFYFSKKLERLYAEKILSPSQLNLASIKSLAVIVLIQIELVFILISNILEGVLFIMTNI